MGVRDQTTPAGEAGHHSGKILVADDDEYICRAAARLLSRAGFEVDWVRTGEAARRALTSSDYDLLVADIYMPGNDDLELVREAASMEQITPVILITAQPSLATAVKALRLSVVDYMTKPVIPNLLVERAQSAIDQGRALRRVQQAHEHVTALKKLLGSIRSTLPMAALEVVAERPPSTVADGLSDEERERLSAREREVLDCLARGEGTADVARSLYISTHTVRNHLKAIYKKLGVSSRSELMRKLLRHQRRG